MLANGFFFAFFLGPSSNSVNASKNSLEITGFARKSFEYYTGLQIILLLQNAKHELNSTIYNKKYGGFFQIIEEI